MEELTHIDQSGQAHMVDVGEKEITRREAVARGRVWMKPETLELVRENAAAKGDVLAVARVAGIQAAKRTGDLIPLCHPLGLSGVEVGFQLGDSGAESRLRSTPSEESGDTAWVDIEAKAGIEARTGVEMEALTAVSAAALTIYDMCKAVDRTMVISDIRLVSKSGGRSGGLPAAGRVMFSVDEPPLKGGRTFDPFIEGFQGKGAATLSLIRFGAMGVRSNFHAFMEQRSGVP